MTVPVIELWHEWNSVHSFKVRVVLAEKGLTWVDHRLELLKFEHLTPQYLRLNPAGVVPTLVHDGKVITESSVICQYLEDVFPSPQLLLDNPHERAKARVWLKVFDDVAHPALRRASFELLYRPLVQSMPRAEMEARVAAHPDPVRAQAFRSLLGPAQPSVVEEAKSVFRAIIVRLDHALEECEWLGGRAFGLADAGMAPFVERLEHLALLDLFRGKAARWSERMLVRPSIIHAKAPPAYRFPAPSERR